MTSLGPLDELLAKQGVPSPEGQSGISASFDAPAVPVPTAPLAAEPTAAEPTAAAPNILANDQLPPIENPDELLDGFARMHGRTPLQAEIRAMRAAPIIARQLGRQPTKLELLAFLEARDETPALASQEFTIGPE